MFAGTYRQLKRAIHPEWLELDAALKCVSAVLVEIVWSYWLPFPPKFCHILCYPQETGMIHSDDKIISNRQNMSHSIFRTEDVLGNICTPIRFQFYSSCYDRHVALEFGTFVLPEKDDMWESDRGSFLSWSYIGTATQIQIQQFVRVYRKSSIASKGPYQKSKYDLFLEDGDACELIIDHSKRNIKFYCGDKLCRTMRFTSDWKKRHLLLRLNGLTHMVFPDRNG